MTPARARRRALRLLSPGRPPRAATWADDPAEGLALAPLLLPAIRSHPRLAIGWGGAEPASDADVSVMLEAIRRHRLFWPAVRAGSPAPAVVVDLRPADEIEAAALLDAAEARAGGTEVVALAPDGALARLARARGAEAAPGLSHVSPEALRLALAPPLSPLPWLAALAGAEGLMLDGEHLRRADPLPWLSRARFIDPWKGRETDAAQGLAALAHLRAAAQANDRPTVTVGFSRWKRRNAAPFLTGPAGPPRHRARLAPALALARDTGARIALWGADAGDGGRAAEDPDGVLRLEDGFLRSVGLGLQHAPPASLAVDAGALYFDATRPTAFEALARGADYPPDLLARAAALRARLVALRLTKYNLPASAPLPETDRPRVLVPGQVEGDASLRYGAPGISTNAELLRAARRRDADAFVLYKPHPDVLTGMRPGAVDEATLAECADAVALDASAAACLDWADRVETMTSLMGFEALMREKAVAVHGRPFYAGWGLTEEAGGPFDRGRALSLDELTAAALILYPRCIDPETRLPAPPERLLEALHEARLAARTSRGRARMAARAALSRALNVVR